MESTIIPLPYNTLGRKKASPNGRFIQQRGEGKSAWSHSIVRCSALSFSLFVTGIVDEKEADRYLLLHPSHFYRSVVCHFHVFARDRHQNLQLL